MIAASACTPCSTPIERLVGVLAFSDVLAAHQSASPIKASELARQPMIAFADETLREVSRQDGLKRTWSATRHRPGSPAAAGGADQPVRPAQGSRASADRGAPPRASARTAPASLRTRQTAPDPRADGMSPLTTGRPLLDEDYQRLLAFRSELRDFLRWSEQAAQNAGLTPSLHQLLLVAARPPHPARADDRTGRRGAAHTPPQRRGARPTRRDHRADPSRARPHRPPPRTPQAHQPRTRAARGPHARAPHPHPNPRVHTRPCHTSREPTMMRPRSGRRGPPGPAASFEPRVPDDDCRLFPKCIGRTQAVEWRPDSGGDAQVPTSVSR